MRYPLEIKNLRVNLVDGFKKYSVIDGIDLKVEQGKITAVVGESGSGKTLTFLSVIRLIPWVFEIESGMIVFDGKDLLRVSDSELRKIRGRKISFIFQEPMTALNPVVNIKKQMTEILTQHGIADYKTACEMAEKSLVDVGIEPFKINLYPHNFSGGQRQRILIAMALLSNPDLVIADEPTTSLDVVTQIEILNLLERLSRERKISFVLISHNISVVYNYSDYVYVMYLGQIVEEGKTDSVIENPAHPYTSALLSSVIKLGLKERIKPIEGLPPEIKDINDGCRFYGRCPFATDNCYNEKPPLKERKDGYYRCWNR